MVQRNDGAEIRGAGGLVLRRDDGTTQLLLVHRVAFRDWTLPKGKAKKRETDQAAALREVGEETGLSCELGPEAGAIHYRDRKGRRKVVRLWLMTPVVGQLTANDEVDDFAWLDLTHAAARATRSGEREFLAEFSGNLIWRGERSDVLSLVVVHEQP
jgi:8-oxo-dGTP diphosphatase